MFNKTIAILVIATGCSKAGPEKATRETEAFIETLNGLIPKVATTVMRFENTASKEGLDQCLSVRDTVDSSNELVMVTVPMPEKVPGLTKCRAQVESTVDKLRDVLSHDSPKGATCDQVGPIWATRSAEMTSAHCRFRAAIDVCKAEANVAGATTELDDVMTICFGKDAEGVTPSKYETEEPPSAKPPSALEPKAPPPAAPPKP